MRVHNGALSAEMRGSGPALGELNRLTIDQIATDERKDSNAANHRQEPFADQRSAALALLNEDCRLTRKAGSFLGQCAVDPTPLTDAQRDWMATLLERADLPPLDPEAAR